MSIFQQNHSIKTQKKYTPDLLQLKKQINKNGQTYKQNKIGDLSLFSPYELYPSQKQYISAIVQGLNSRQNILVQSPTGSGKTLSLLLSTLTWLSAHSTSKKQPIRIIYTSRTHAQLKQAIGQLKKISPLFKNLSMAVLSSRQHSCINPDMALMSKNAKDLQCRLRIAKKKNLFCKYFQFEDFYMSMNEINKGMNQQPQAQQNKMLGKMSDLQQMGQIGLNSGFCPYFYEKAAVKKANIIFSPYNYLFQPTFSVNGQQNPLANILANSIIILDEAHNIPSVCQNAEQLSISLSTFASAHHQLQQFREDILQNLNEKIKQRNQNMKNQNADKRKSKSRQIIDQEALLHVNTNDLEINISYIQDMLTHMQLIKIDSVQQQNQAGLCWDVKQLFQFISASTKDNIHGRLGKQMFEHLSVKIPNIKAAMQYRPYMAIEVWFSFCLKVNSLIKAEQSQSSQAISLIESTKIVLNFETTQIKMTIVSLDPSVGFRQFAKKKPYSIILTSGTLNPLKTWERELKVPFPNPIACHHQIDKKQIKACILKTTLNNKSLNFQYKYRNDKTLFESLGNILVQIFRNTPNGLIVLFPSYLVLETLRTSLMNSNLMNSLYQHKRIFYQQKNSKNFEATLSSFMKSAVRSEGAALFALVRGKVAQGLDFSDEKCRAVILVGVPFPAMKDLKIQAKMKYLDIQCEKLSKMTQKQCNSLSPSEKGINRKDWYMTQTVRAVNQSIGRIIRHPKDYGAVYLLDERYMQADIVSQLPSWIRDSLDVIENAQRFRRFTESCKKDFQHLQDEARIAEIQSKKSSQSLQNPANHNNFTFVSHRGTKISTDFEQMMKIQQGKRQQKNASISMVMNQDQKKKYFKDQPNLTGTYKNQKKTLHELLNETRQKQKRLKQEKQKEKQDKVRIIAQNYLDEDDSKNEIDFNLRAEKPTSKTKGSACPSLANIARIGNVAKSYHIQKSVNKAQKTKSNQKFSMYLKTCQVRKTHEECPVCRNRRKLIGNTECVHQLCRQCWDVWLTKDLRCPICRVRVRAKFLKIQDDKDQAV